MNKRQSFLLEETKTNPKREMSADDVQFRSRIRND